MRRAALSLTFKLTYLFDQCDEDSFCFYREIIIQFLSAYSDSLLSDY